MLSVGPSSLTRLEITTRTFRCPASVWRASTRPAVTLAGRRRFALLVTLNLAAAATYFGTATKAWAEPQPETTRIRLVRIPSICQAPQYVAEELLSAEGSSLYT